MNLLRPSGNLDAFSTSFPTSVSYVVTAFNSERYIRESVGAAFRQTLEPLEIVLSDDASSDRTFEIMAELAASYEGPHTVVLNRNPERLGIVGHMNRVFLEVASGEVLVVAHADDISDPRRAEVSVRYLQANPNCKQVAVSATVVDMDLHPYAEPLQGNCRVAAVREYELGSGAHVPVGFSAFRRSVMNFFGPLGSACPTEDDAIGFRALILGQVAFIPDRLVVYRKHPASSSNPNNFGDFPLEAILEQNLKDLRLGHERGVVSSELHDSEARRLSRAFGVRAQYRAYVAERTVLNLARLVLLPGITMRRRLVYLKLHLTYLMHGAAQDQSQRGV